MSRHLKLLEEEFKVKLYRKLSQGIQLTPEGEKFLEVAKNVVADFNRLRELFRANSGEENSLRIGASYGPRVSFLADLLTAFGDAHPGVQTSTKSLASELIERMLLNGELDLALITEPSHSEKLVYEPCGKGDIVPCVSARHPLATRKVVAKSQLPDVPLILRQTNNDRSTRTWKYLSDLVESADKLNVSLECDSHRVIRQAVIEGRGVGFTYRDAIARLVKQKRVVELQIEGFANPYTIYLVYRKDRALSRAAQAFVAMALERGKHA